MSLRTAVLFDLGQADAGFIARSPDRGFSVSICLVRGLQRRQHPDCRPERLGCALRYLPIPANAVSQKCRITGLHLPLPELFRKRFVRQAGSAGHAPVSQESCVAPRQARPSQVVLSRLPSGCRRHRSLSSFPLTVSVCDTHPYSSEPCEPCTARSRAFELWNRRRDNCRQGLHLGSILVERTSRRSLNGHMLNEVRRVRRDEFLPGQRPDMPPQQTRSLRRTGAPPVLPEQITGLLFSPYISPVKEPAERLGQIHDRKALSSQPLLIGRPQQIASSRVEQRFQPATLRRFNLPAASKDRDTPLFSTLTDCSH